MYRADEGLAFMLRYENIAWYENGEVRILDRRVYPRKVEFVTCRRHEEVARAIADMVTQSAGPFTAAAMGMALAAHESTDLQYLKRAAYTLSHARPTTSARMEQITNGCFEAASNALMHGKDPSEAVVKYSVDLNNRRYDKIRKIAEHLVSVFPHNGTVMTQCFGETIVGQMLKVAREKGNDLKLICPETRPYFQGARLTATVINDMGFDVTVITDNMAAYAMEKKGVDVFTSAADVITMDGHVVNKVGTYQIAICAKHIGLPYYVTGTPDRAHLDRASITIEERDPSQTLTAMGIKTAADGVKGWYPAFDITPPELVKGVVTDMGILSPYDLKSYTASDKDITV